MTVDISRLREVGLEAGLCAVGVCDASAFVEVGHELHRRKAQGLHGGMEFTYRNPDRSVDASRALPGAQSLVVGALDYHRSRPEPPPDGRPHARVASYAWADYYAALRRALDAMASVLREQGHRAIVVADENSLVDRAAAHRAGIGWWGKSANVLIPGVGSMVVLGSVITDATISGHTHLADDGCGSCQKCLDGCPTGAFVAPGVIDARRCLAWLVQQEGVFEPEYREALGDRLYGCDDCQDVCPPNSVRFRRPAPATDGEPWVDVLAVLAASDEQLIERFGRWYIPNREPRYLRRNALVVLGNIGDADDPGVAAAVNVALADPDPLIRSHAVWCARRLGLGLAALAGADHPMVITELQSPIAAVNASNAP